MTNTKPKGDAAGDTDIDGALPYTRGGKARADRSRQPQPAKTSDTVAIAEARIVLSKALDDLGRGLIAAHEARLALDRLDEALKERDRNERKGRA